MIVCHCRVVSCREIRRSIRDGATTRREVARACGASAVCGGCRPAVEAILREELAEPEPVALLEGLEAAPAR